jgi:antitoxin YefM
MSEKNNEVVLVSPDESDSWKETLYLLSSPANAEHLRQSIAEANAGKFDEKALLDE